MSLELLELAEVAPKSYEWLWKGYIPLGGITLLAGDTAMGKSFVTMDIAARVSNGELVTPKTYWPDDEGPVEHGNVVILSAEDDPETVLVPRLRALGANMANISCVTTRPYVEQNTGHKRYRTFSLETDVPELERLLDDNKFNVKLLIIDPIATYAGKADSHKDAAVKALLDPLNDLARRMNIAVLGVSHLNKDATKSAAYRTNGSVAWSTSSRSHISISADREDPDRRLFLSVKVNNAPRPDGLAYRIVSTSGNPDAMPKLYWEKLSMSMSADMALQSDPMRDDARARAELFVKDILIGGQYIKIEHIKEQADKKHLSWTAVREMLHTFADRRQGGPGKPHAYILKGCEEVD